MRSLFILPCLLAATMMAVPESATSASPLSMVQVSSAAADIPLVVIRFNQRNVRYSKQLYTAISRAVEIKPSVSFELVSYIPATHNQGLNMKHQQRAASEVAGIMKTLTSMGIPSSRIKHSKQPDGDIKFHESHLYVY